MYHFAWADQREKQGYKSDVLQIKLYPGKINLWCKPATDVTAYIDIAQWLSIAGLNLLASTRWTLAFLAEISH